MRLITVLTLLTLGIAASNSQWVSNYGGNNTGDINFANAKGIAVTVDNAGYSYVTGYCYEVLSGNDIITIKYNQVGDTLWVKSYNGTSNSNDEGSGICVDASGNVYVLGSAQNLNKGYDIVILKYSSSGSLIWKREYSTSANDKGTGIYVNSTGYIFITGYGTAGNESVVTQKYSPSGTLLWTAYDESNSGNSRGTAIAVGTNGDAYVTGYVSNSNSSDVVLLKYSGQNGSNIFRQTNGDGGEDKAWGIVVDQSDNIYITGFTTVFGNQDAYTLKYNSSGSLLWSKRYNGSGNSTDKAWGIVVDTDGSTYITGESRGSNVNYMTVKYSSSGTQIWASSYNGTGNGTDAAISVGFFTDANNIKNVVVTGKSWGTNNNYDYATVKYNSQTGSQTQVARYSMSGLSSDIAEDLCVSDVLNKVYVTGSSELIVESNHGESYVSTMMLDFGPESETATGNNTPQKFELHQNYPNPFNPSTTIKFDIATASNVKLAVYDMLGRVVDVLVNQDLDAGSYSIMYNNKGLSSGIYFYELTSGSMKEIKKMTLVK